MTHGECEAARVLLIGDPLLTQRAAPIPDPGGADAAAVARWMRATLAATGGVGLAAPQIGILARVILFRVPPHRVSDDPDDGVTPLTVVVNPVLTPESDEMTLAREACLSIPGDSGMVRRWRRLRWSGFDLVGRPIGGVAGGFRARVLQHECDHLDGVLYCQRLIPADQVADDQDPSAGAPQGVPR